MAPHAFLGRVFAVGGFQHLMARLGQQVAQQAADAFFVIHHQYARGHLRRPESLAHLGGQRVGVEGFLQEALPESTSKRYAAALSV